MKTIYLMRHGQSEDNKGPVFLGADARLTDRGKEEASLVAIHFRSVSLDVIISSTLPRARETAEIIANDIPVPVEYSDLFVERRRPTEQIGLLIESDAFRKINADIYEHLASSRHRYSDEENFDDFNARAKAALSFIEQRQEENILVVSHNMFICILVGKALLGDHFDGYAALQCMSRLRIANGGMSILRYGNPTTSHPGIAGVAEQSVSPWELIAWNDQKHLG